MANASSDVMYYCLDHVYWVKDKDQVVVVVEKQQSSFLFRGVELAIWTWLISGYQTDELRKQISVLLAISEAESQNILLQTLESWFSKGILGKEAA